MTKQIKQNFPPIEKIQRVGSSDGKMQELMTGESDINLMVYYKKEQKHNPFYQFQSHLERNFKNVQTHHQKDLSRISFTQSKYQVGLIFLTHHFINSDSVSHEQMISKYLQMYPFIQPVFLFLKSFLQRKGVLGFSRGFSSLSLLLMLVAFLQH